MTLCKNVSLAYNSLALSSGYVIDFPGSRVVLRIGRPAEATYHHQLHVSGIDAYCSPWSTPAAAVLLHRYDRYQHCTAPRSAARVSVGKVRLGIFRKSGSHRILGWRKTDSKPSVPPVKETAVERGIRGQPSSSRENDPIRLIGPVSPFGNSRDPVVRAGPMVRIQFPRPESPLRAWSRTSSALSGADLSRRGDGS